MGVAPDRIKHNGFCNVEKWERSLIRVIDQAKVPSGGVVIRWPCSVGW